ncbi:MAG: tetratricopeptide repeat protein, partial [Acidobacteriota bacterium]|nr:tetratricopeptide repeat protein [Acidobacteriota bacterium]
ELRPIAFGMGWFLISSLPTSWIALSEVENDHRMYMPFAGLTLAVCWAAALALEKRRVPARIVAPVCGLLLAGFAWSAHERNKVWKTDESLWYDVTVKSPHNGRGLMNYGLSQMERGRTDVALDYFLRAAVFSPDYYVLEINTGIAYSLKGNTAEAEKHFLRSLELAPREVWPRYYYARWLASVNRRAEAIAQLETGVRLNPDYLPARDLLIRQYAENRDAENLRRLARETLARFPTDAAAISWLAVPVPEARTDRMSADAYVAQSLAFYRAGQYPESIQAAREALKLRPDYAEAWNNIGAAYNQMGKWDAAIDAEKNAIRLKPGLQIARNNLAAAMNGLKAAAAKR